MILKIFSPKNLVKIFAFFLLKLLLVFFKIVIITLVFEKKTILSPKIGKKSQKIVIITSTLGSWVCFSAAASKSSSVCQMVYFHTKNPNFYPLWYVVPRKIWQPCLECWKKYPTGIV
jgi:hypothetical protein